MKRRALEKRALQTKSAEEVRSATNMTLAESWHIQSTLGYRRRRRGLRLLKHGANFNSRQQQLFEPSYTTSRHFPHSQHADVVLSPPLYEFLGHRSTHLFAMPRRTTSSSTFRSVIPLLCLLFLLPCILAQEPLPKRLRIPGVGLSLTPDYGYAFLPRRSVAFFSLHFTARQQSTSPTDQSQK